MPGRRALVNSACPALCPRIGMIPEPMTGDYEQVIRTCQVTVAEEDAGVAGVIVLPQTASR
jgi:hypothetical protein